MDGVIDGRKRGRYFASICNLQLYIRVNAVIFYMQNYWAISCGVTNCILFVLLFIYHATLFLW